jgi:glycosyltransferase involved in cell wall biosynthesis
MNKARTIYFYRKFNRFTGGHLKVWDYFNHIKLADDYLPFIYLEPGGDVSEINPWLSSTQNQLPEWSPLEADVLFLAGMDWFTLPYPERRNWPKPIINLIQGFRHSIPNTPLYDCLSNYAIRICVSQEVSNSILATGRVNGPVFTIPNGIDTTLFPKQKPYHDRNIDILIVGIKKPDLALQIEQQICNLKLNKKTHTVTDLIPRKDFLDLLSDSKVAVFLPFDKEGFYLPALEGMALGTIVICPDCLGNRSFCKNGINSIVPFYFVDGIMDSIKTALNMNRNEINNILDSANATSNHHNIDNEHQSFLKILTFANNLWK